MLKKLRIKFVCIVMTIVTIMLVIMLVGMVHFTKNDLQQSTVQMMYNVAQRPVIPNKPNISRDEINLPYFIVQINPDGSFATVGKFFDLSDTDFILEIINRADNSKSSVGEIEEYNLRYCKNDIPDKKIVFADISSEITAVKNLIKNCIAIGFMAFGAFLGLSMYISKWAIKPVEEAWNHQKQFVADASHELKTPLAVILTNAELIKSDEYTENEKQQFADNMLTMSRHMRSLVESLLELARVDSGNIKAKMELTDLSLLVEDALLPFEPMFFEQGKVLQSDIEHPVKLKVSRGNIIQTVNVLLDNALKYSSEGTEVTVKLKKNGCNCILSVSSSGESISEEDLKNIFKRFYRTDKSRSRNGSFGLGLAIAKSVVNEHGGKIWAESKNGINTFFIQLPL